MAHKPGETWYLDPVITRDQSGKSVVPDSAPTGRVYHNGTYDASVTVTYVNEATGRYLPSIAIPSGYVGGDDVYVLSTVSVGGNATDIPSGTTTLDAGRQQFDGAGNIKANLQAVQGATTVDGMTFANWFIYMAARLLGKVTNAGTDTESTTGADQSTARLSDAVDAAGDRTVTFS